MKRLKIAIVHDYLHVYGGAEAVVHAIWELYPDADIYTATYDSEVMKKVGVFQKANIIYPKWKDNIPGSLKIFIHKILIANLPIYFENLDLDKYDLILSSSAHFAKGVITKPNQLHISYIHTPPRFLYGYPGETRKRDSKIWRLILGPLDMILRVLDYRFAQRPDYLLCNSKTVKARIKKFYHRDAKVINPFPNIGAPKHVVSGGKYYLIVSRLAEYKNIDLAIKVCGKNKLPLKIAGAGPADDRLRELADKYDTVEMLGFVSEDEKMHLYSGCKAVLCTVKDEDFGMAPLEAMLYGKPVVALKDAGYLETVVDGVTGAFFGSLTEKSLYKGIKKLDEINFDPRRIRKHADSFSKERFQKEYKAFVDSKVKEHLKRG